VSISFFTLLRIWLYVKLFTNCFSISDLRHPNIVLFLGACLEPNNVFFITEFVGQGNLHELINERPPSWKQRILFALHIARGMNYLHQNDPMIVHRDLKSLNVLVRMSNIVVNSLTKINISIF